MSIRRQRAHYVTGRGSDYLGQPRLRLFSGEAQKALSIVKKHRVRNKRGAGGTPARPQASPGSLTITKPPTGFFSPNKTASKDSTRRGTVAGFVTTQARKKFHRYDCAWAADLVSADTYIAFGSKEAALKAGYRRCRTCMP